MINNRTKADIPKTTDILLFIAFTSAAGDYTYENSDNGFAIDYPSDWQVIEGNPATFTPPSADLSESQMVQVVVTAYDKPVSSTLQGFTSWEINYLRTEANGFTLSQSYPSTLAGLPAYVLEYSDNGYLSGSPEMSLEIFTMDEQGTAYTIAYSANPDLFTTYLPDAKGMIETFALTGVPSSSSSDSGSSSSQPGDSSSAGGGTSSSVVTKEVAAVVVQHPVLVDVMELLAWALVHSVPSIPTLVSRLYSKISHHSIPTILEITY